MLSGVYPPQVLSPNLKLLHGSHVQQLAWLVSFAVTAGFSLRSTPSSSAQKPFTPLEPACCGTAEMTNWLFVGDPAPAEPTELTVYPLLEPLARMLSIMHALVLVGPLVEQVAAPGPRAASVVGYPTAGYDVEYSMF